MTSKLVWLIDVNALIALIDPNHVHHNAMHAWFEARNPTTWASSPLVENGVIRVLSQPSYAGGPFAPAHVIGILEALKQSFAGVHRTLPDSVSLCDPAIFRREFIAGPKQVTDAYLLGLAFANKLRLVSFDRSLPWQAIRGATRALVEIPAAHKR